MSVANLNDGAPRDVNPDYFTGNVNLSEISTRLDSGQDKIYRVKFPGGSKTKIHHHTGPQILVPTAGTGILIVYKKIGRGVSKFRIKQESSSVLKVGKIAYVKAGVLHAHGASSEKTFSHVAINLPPEKEGESETVWYESDFKSTVTQVL